MDMGIAGRWALVCAASKGLGKACAKALRDHPECNASWSEDEMVQYGAVDISVAVATDRGLITPIVRNADTKGVAQISIEMKDLATRAKDGKLKLDEFQGGGFTISNLGMFGVKEFAAIIKIGRTHLEDATPLTVGQEWSGYAAALADAIVDVEHATAGLLDVAMGGTAVGTGLNSPEGFGKEVAAVIAKLTGYPFKTAENKFAAQGTLDRMVRAHAGLKSASVTLFKIANDMRWLGSGPRTGLMELILPSNEPGSSIMPGKVNPTQCEALTMIAVQVMANDVAVGMGGAGGYLEMNVYKPLIIYNITHSLAILADGCTNFRKFLVEGTKPNLKKIGEYVERSLMLVTALAPVIGYDKASKIAHYAMDNDLTLKQAALKLGFVTEAEFDRVVDPKKMTAPYVAKA